MFAFLTKNIVKMIIYIYQLLFLGLVQSKPIETDVINTTPNGFEILGQNRAGLIDMLNPQNWNNSNKEGNTAANLLPNPFQNLLNQTQGQTSSALNDVKLFFVTVQGALLPASVITGGFTNLLQGLGNMGNLFGNLGQSVQNLNPFNQNT